MVDGRQLLFEIVDLQQGVFTMRDDATGTLWNHLDGKAVQGQLKGARLPMIALQQTTWEAWRAEHPNTTVLAFNTTWQRHYQLVPIGEFAIDEARFGDGRLPANELVLGVESNDSFRGYQFSTLKTAGGVVNDALGGRPIVAAYHSTTGNAMAYSRRVGGTEITFRLAQDGGRPLIEDAATGSRWTIGGQPVSGPLATAPLEFVPSIITEWYGWSAYHPQSTIYGK